jgi:ribulose-phosphate 3-epimerase
MKTPIIAPSLLAANFGTLHTEVAMVQRSQADWLHIDVMDGTFVPNISFGFVVIDAIKPLCNKPFDVHLMIENPDRYLEKFVASGANILTVHLEACTHLHRTIAQIKKLGARAGVAINPHTSVDLLVDVLNDVDLVCIMSVNPGFGGQVFIENTYKKIQRLAALRTQQQAHFFIEIDGGVGTHNAQKLITAGADVLVAGNCVFGSQHPEQTIATLKNASVLRNI